MHTAVRFEMLNVEEEIFAKILQTFDRTEASFEDDVAVVRKWLQTQPHLPEVMDDDRIRNFLLLNKCSIEKCKQKIDNYYTLRPLVAEFYISPKSEAFRRAMDIAYWLMLPKLTKDMCRVHVIKVKKPELMDELDPYAFITQATQFQEVRLKEDRMFKDIAIMDMRGYTWGYLFKLTPTVLGKFYAIMEKMYSNRLQALYIINRFPSIQYFLGILKPIMKQKVYDRIQVCEDASLLFKVLPKEMIPSDYGGEEKSMEELGAMMRKKLDENQERFEELDRMRVNEDLRPQKLNNDEVLGFHGNFKKLDVD